MSRFQRIVSLTELKLIYRRLAMLHHPDHGGDPRIMQGINVEYEQAKKRIQQRMSLLSKLQPGDTVYVNDTKCYIKSCTETTFTAKAIDRKKSAIFSRETGICINNSSYTAYVHLKKTQSNAY